MFDILWHWLVYSIPWEVKLAGAAVVLGILLALFRTYWKEILVVGGVIGAGILLNRAKQQGYADREAKGRQDAEKAIAEADAARRDADTRNADPERLRDNDGARRD